MAMTTAESSSIPNKPQLQLQQQQPYGHQQLIPCSRPDSNASSLISSSIQTSASATTASAYSMNPSSSLPLHFPKQHQQEQCRSISIDSTLRHDRTPYSAVEQFLSEHEIPAAAIRLECGHHISGQVEQSWNLLMSRLSEDHQNISRYQLKIVKTFWG
jgi:hypothetical protein